VASPPIREATGVGNPVDGSAVQPSIGNRSEVGFVDARASEIGVANTPTGNVQVIERAT